MVDHAKKNNKVLRLKGGDPSFFSRGSQEIEFLKKKQIKYKIFYEYDSLKWKLVN